MTIINPKNITGVTSITTPSGSDNLFTVHTSDTTERFRIDSTGTASFGGDVSIGGTVSVGGTITYEDVTNVDSVGLITARNGIEIGARPGVAASISVDGNMIVSGITTFTPGGSEIVRINSGGLLAYNDVSFFGASTNAYWDKSANQFLLNDNTKISLGNSSDLQLYHDGTHTYLNNTTGNLRIQNNGTVKTAQFEVDQIDFNDSANSTVHLRKEPAGNLKVYKNLNVVGVCTAASFESATFSKTPTNTPAFHAYQSGNSSPSLSDNTWTKVTILTTETLDTDSAYDGDKFTVPSGKGGYYHVSAGINFYADNNDMKNARIAIYKNGSAVLRSYNLINNYAAGIRHFQVTQSGVLNLSASDYLEVYVNTTTNGGSASYISNDTNGVGGNHFSAFKLII